MKKHCPLSLIGGLFLCIALLSACGASSNSASSAPLVSKTASSTIPMVKTVTTTPVPTTSTVVTPTVGTTNVTPAISTATDNSNSGGCNTTYGCGTGSSNLTLYKGNGYTINYPGSWVIKSDGDMGSLFSAPDGATSLHVFVQHSSTLTNPLQYEFGTSAKDNCQAVPSGLPVIITNGVTWQQSQYTCQPADNSNHKEVGILTATGVYNNKYYSIDYITSPNNFDTADQNFFQPMVSSFNVQ